MYTTQTGTYQEIESLRTTFIDAMNCQFVRTSIIPRRLADVYTFKANQELIGYAGIWNKYTPGRIMEFYLIPEWQSNAEEFIQELVEVSGASSIETQTNVPFMNDVFEKVASNKKHENYLFDFDRDYALENGNARLRIRSSSDIGPEGDWVLEKDKKVVGAGGITFHYNPPFADIYMEVSEPERRKGIGSFIVQELCRVCILMNKKPSARCDYENELSRKTLIRGGMKVCGEILSGDIK